MLDITQIVLQQLENSLLSSKFNTMTEQLLQFDVTSAALKLVELENETTPALMDTFVKMVLLNLYLFKFINKPNQTDKIFDVDTFYLISRFAASSNPDAFRCINIFGFAPRWFQTIHHKIYATDAVTFFEQIKPHSLDVLKSFLCQFIDFYKSIVRVDESTRLQLLDTAVPFVFKRACKRVRDNDDDINKKPDSILKPDPYTRFVHGHHFNSARKRVRWSDKLVETE